MGRLRWGRGGAASAGPVPGCRLLGQDAAMSRADSGVGGAGREFTWSGQRCPVAEGSGATPDRRCLVDRGSSL